VHLRHVECKGLMSGVWNQLRAAEMGIAMEICPQLQISHVAHAPGRWPVGLCHITHGKEGNVIIEYR